MYDIADLRLYMKGIPVSLQDTSDSSFHIRCRAFQSRKQAAPLKQPGNNRPLLLQYASTFSVYQKTAVTNQYHLPIMYAEDYAKAGRRMLERYYPEALEKPTAVDGWELAKRMKLKARRVRFEQGSDIQGRIYFDWTRVRIRDESGRITEIKVPPMTILINTDLCPTAEIENSTLIHECCHVFLDLFFFKLQMLSGKPFTSYTSRKRKKKQFNTNNGPIDWMELQAEKLPAYILLEENNTRKEIERLLDMKDGVRSPENIFWIVCQLAATFKVSRSMAKYRMIELGFVKKLRIPQKFQISPAGEKLAGYFHGQIQEVFMEIQCDECGAVAEYSTPVHRHRQG